MDHYEKCPSGKVPLWPPNGGQEPTYFLERHVGEKLTQGWTLEPHRPKPSPRRAKVTTRRSTATDTTDKPKQSEQGTEESE